MLEIIKNKVSSTACTELYRQKLMLDYKTIHLLTASLAVFVWLARVYSVLVWDVFVQYVFVWWVFVWWVFVWSVLVHSVFVWYICVCLNGLRLANDWLGCVRLVCVCSVCVCLAIVCSIGFRLTIVCSFHVIVSPVLARSLSILLQCCCRFSRQCPRNALTRRTPPVLRETPTRSVRRKRRADFSCSSTERKRSCLLFHFWFVGPIKDLRYVNYGINYIVASIWKAEYIMCNLACFSRVTFSSGNNRWASRPWLLCGEFLHIMELY